MADKKDEGEGMISGMRCKKDTPFGGAAGGRGPVGPRSQKRALDLMDSYEV